MADIDSTKITFLVQTPFLFDKPGKGISVDNMNFMNVLKFTAKGKTLF